jgi:hypothetical protein
LEYDEYIPKREQGIAGYHLQYHQDLHFGLYAWIFHIILLRLYRRPWETKLREL